MKPPIPSVGAPEPVSDEMLVARARAGDSPAFEALYHRYKDRVYQTAMRILGHREDALDIAQEIFLSVHRSLDGFAEKSRFGTWLFRIAVNRCRDELRRRRSVKHTRPRSLDTMARARDDEGGFDPPAPGAGPLETLSARERHAAAEAALAKLPDDLREILVLREIEELGYDEIAAILEIPVGTVRSRLHRARDVLARSLAAGGAAEDRS